MDIDGTVHGLNVETETEPADLLSSLKLDDEIEDNTPPNITFGSEMVLPNMLATSRATGSSPNMVAIQDSSVYEPERWSW